MSVLSRGFDLLSYLWSHSEDVDILMWYWPIYTGRINGPVSLERIMHTHEDSSQAAATYTAYKSNVGITGLQ